MPPHPASFGLDHGLKALGRRDEPVGLATRVTNSLSQTTIGVLFGCE